MADAALSWDADGNLASYSGLGYAHDPENRLITVTSGTQTAGSYSYDPFGRRVTKTESCGGAACIVSASAAETHRLTEKERSTPGG